MQDKSKKAIVVLGFHRGGTSAMAGALVKSGAIAPKTLIGPVQGENDKGFWESALLTKLNDLVLQDSNQYWDQLTLDGLSKQRALPVTCERREQIADIIREEFELTGAPIVIKDPRICRLIHVWDEILRELEFVPVYVLVLRSADECARSLNFRNQMPEEVAHLLWMQYMAAAERGTRGKPRVLLRYEDLLDNPRECIAGLDDQLALGLISESDSGKQLDNYIDRSLRHHKSQSMVGILDGSRLTAEIYRLLASCESCGVQENLDRVWQSADGVLRLLAPIIATRDKQLAKLQNDLESARYTASEAMHLLENIQCEFADLQTEFGQFRSQLSIERGKTRSLELSFLGRTMKRFQRMVHALQNIGLVAAMVVFAKQPIRRKSLMREFRHIQKADAFDAQYYLARYPHLQWMLTSPLLHYLCVGHRIGYNPRADFNEEDYKQGIDHEIFGSSLADSLMNYKDG